MNYNFYIQKYGYQYWDSSQKQYKSTGNGRLLDIEEQFNCKYVRMEGISEDGKVKNVYTEEYAETEELRIYTPNEILCENNEVSLTLLFLAVGNNEFDVQSNERKFYEYVRGRKIEYHDTFRQRYLTLLLLNKPEVVGEVLYGDSRYRQVKYTFKNVYGRSFDKSKM